MNRPKISLLAMLLAVTAWAPLESLKAQDAAAPKSNTPPSVQTPNSGPAAKLDEATLGKMFDAFATIAGGWYLEQRCNFFGKEYKAEFDWNVAQINIALSRQARPGFLLQLQQSARNVAESKDLLWRDQRHNRVHIGQKQGNDQVPYRPNLYTSARFGAGRSVYCCFDLCAEARRQMQGYACRYAEGI